MSELIKYGMILFLTGLGVIAQILMRKGLSKYKDMNFNNFIVSLLMIVTRPIIITAFLCFGGGMVVYMFVLSKLEVTYIYPVTTSLTFGGVAVFGHFLLGDSLNMKKIAGIVLIVLGIVTIDRFG